MSFGSNVEILKPSELRKNSLNSNEINIIKYKNLLEP